MTEEYIKIITEAIDHLNIVCETHNNKKYVYVDFKEILLHDAHMADIILEDYEQFSFYFEKVLQDQEQYEGHTFKIRNFFDSEITPIWTIRSHSVNKIIQIKGYVNRATVTRFPIQRGTG